jgi:hypothetical protein
MLSRRRVRSDGLHKLSRSSMLSISMELGEV